jgi:hypothetical protein
MGKLLQYLLRSSVHSADTRNNIRKVALVILVVVRSKVSISQSRHANSANKESRLYYIRHLASLTSLVEGGLDER